MTADAALLAIFAAAFGGAIGAAAGWPARGNRQAFLDSSSAVKEPMVTMTIDAPARLFPSMVAGFGGEIQGILIPGTFGAPGPDPDGGIDEATGLPFRGPESEQ